MIEHIDVYQGVNATVTLHARDSSNVVQNLTGLTVTWGMGEPPNDPTKLFSTVTHAGTIISAALGTYSVAITPADTSNLVPGNYVHMTYTTTAAGLIAVVNQGRLRLRPLVTQL